MTLILSTYKFILIFTIKVKFLRETSRKWYKLHTHLLVILVTTAWLFFDSRINHYSSALLHLVFTSIKRLKWPGSSLNLHYSRAIIQNSNLGKFDIIERKVSSNESCSLLDQYILVLLIAQNKNDLSTIIDSQWVIPVFFIRAAVMFDRWSPRLRPKIPLPILSFFFIFVHGLPLFFIIFSIII